MANKETDPDTTVSAEVVVPAGLHLPRPHRGFAELRADSRPVAVITCLVGGLALALLLGGTAVQLWAGGLANPANISATLKSATFDTTSLVAAVAGGLAAVLALFTYRRLDTGVARSLSMVGGVFGAEALVLGVALMLFAGGDTATFANNFLNFPAVTEQMDAFLNGMKNTVLLALAAGAGGMTLGLLIASLAISHRAVVRAPARIYINVMRGTPILVQLSLIFFGISLGLHVVLSAFAALVLTLSLNSAAYYAEIFRAGLQSIERGQLEASRGLGLSYVQTFRLVIVPQAVRRVIPPLLNEFVGLVKDTSLIVFLGVTINQRELFVVAQQGYAESFNATFYVFAALGYLVITIPMISLVNVVERRLRSGLVSFA